MCKSGRRVWKVLGSDGQPCQGGTGKWSLPQNGHSGEWMPLIRNLAPCRRGYHLCRDEHLVYWLGPRIFLAEGRGECVDDTNKIVYAEARLLREAAWNDRVARLFACDCAEHVLHVFKQHYAHDDRPRISIATARRYAHGECGPDEFATAHSDAWRAVWATHAPNTPSFQYAAKSAAWCADSDINLTTYLAIGSARRCAPSHSEERAWQTARLMEYLGGTNDERW